VWLRFGSVEAVVQASARRGRGERPISVLNIEIYLRNDVRSFK
jgi:hypothetical protein